MSWFYAAIVAFAVCLAPGISTTDKAEREDCFIVAFRCLMWSITIVALIYASLKTGGHL